MRECQTWKFIEEHFRKIQVKRRKNKKIKIKINTLLSFSKSFLEHCSHHDKKYENLKMVNHKASRNIHLPSLHTISREINWESTASLQPFHFELLTSWNNIFIPLHVISITASACKTFLSIFGFSARHINVLLWSFSVGVKVSTEVVFSSNTWKENKKQVARTSSMRFHLHEIPPTPTQKKNGWSRVFKDWF